MHALSVQGQQRWEEAIAACQEGMALPSATRDFRPLRDAIAVQAALAGCYAGFQGRWLDVSYPSRVTCIAHSDRALHGRSSCRGAAHPLSIYSGYSGPVPAAKWACS